MVINKLSLPFSCGARGYLADGHEDLAVMLYKKDI